MMTEKLYVLDAANGRVVVLAKTGEYESQYMSEEMKKATGLVVTGRRERYIYWREQGL